MASDLINALNSLSGKLDKLASAGSPMETFKGYLQNIKVPTTKEQWNLQHTMGVDQARAYTQRMKQMAPLARISEGFLNAGLAGIGGIRNQLSDRDIGIKTGTYGALGAAGGMMGDLGGKLMSTGNPYAMAAGAALKFAGAVAEIPSKIKEWGDHLHEQNRMFADFSASMASVMAADDARRVGLQQEQGERRAASARELSDARYRLDKAMAPIEDAFANLKNKVVAKLTDVLADLAEEIKKLFPGGGDSENLKETIYGWGGLTPDSMARLEKEVTERRPKRLR